MAETLAALLLAHALADFVFQSARVAAAKAQRHPGALALHIGVVAACTAAALGAVTPAALLLTAAIAFAHLVIDIAKTFARAGLGAFLADQGAHLATMIVAAALVPAAWDSGAWSALPQGPAVMAIAAGVILSVRAGGFAVGLLMQPWNDAGLDGLPGAGRTIGYLERGLVFVLILTGEPGGIGLLIAAKSVLRFGAVRDEARLSEYVIVGTLASFGWAIVTAAGTLWLLQALPPLGIPDLSP